MSHFALSLVWLAAAAVSACSWCGKVKVGARHRSPRWAARPGQRKQRATCWHFGYSSPLHPCTSLANPIRRQMQQSGRRRHSVRALSPPASAKASALLTAAVMHTDIVHVHGSPATPHPGKRAKGKRACFRRQPVPVQALPRCTSLAVGAAGGHNLPASRASDGSRGGQGRFQIEQLWLRLDRGKQSNVCLTFVGRRRGMWREVEVPEGGQSQRTEERVVQELQVTQQGQMKGEAASGCRRERRLLRSPVLPSRCRAAADAASPMFRAAPGAGFVSQCAASISAR